MAVEALSRVEAGLHAMIRTAGIKEEVLVNLQVEKKRVWID